MIPIIPIAPTIKKKVVKFIITSYFLDFDFAINLKPKKAKIITTPRPIRNKDIYSISCFIRPARITPPKISLAISKQNLPASTNKLFLSSAFIVSFLAGILLYLSFCAAKVQQNSDICKYFGIKLQNICNFAVISIRQRSFCLSFKPRGWAISLSFNCSLCKALSFSVGLVP